jgi:hypothetical protein
MWVAAKTLKLNKYDYHMRQIQEKSSDALDWLNENLKVHLGPRVDFGGLMTNN